MKRLELHLWQLSSTWSIPLVREAIYMIVNQFNLIAGVGMGKLQLQVADTPV